MVEGVFPGEQCVALRVDCAQNKEVTAMNNILFIGYLSEL